MNTPLQDLLPEELCAPFRAARWPATYFVHHGAFERLPAWMRAPALTSAVNLRRTCPFANVTVNHSGVHFQAALPSADASAIELFAKFGLTLSFSNVSDALPGARTWLDGLADDLGIARPQAELGVFVSAPGQGLVPHFDAYDAFVVQLHGKKRWHVGKTPAVEAPVDIQYAPGTPPSEYHAAIMCAQGVPEKDPAESEVDMHDLEPGSVLFVPRGTWHSTTASNEVSISASLFMNVPSIGDLMLAQLHKVIAQDPRLRTPGIGFASSDTVQRQRAAELFESTLPLLAKNVGRLRAQAAFESSVPNERLADRLDKTTRFLRDPSRLIDFDAAPADEGFVRLRVTDTARAKPQIDALPDLLVMPPAALPLVRWIHERRGVFTMAAAMEAFPMFDAPSVASVLAELVTLHVLLLVPFGPAAHE